MVLEAIRYRNHSLQILDQLRLPHEEVYVQVRDPQDGWNAIKSMQVRGAPAIAIVAALSLAAHLEVKKGDLLSSSSSASRYISQSLRFLTTSRPTAVNLLDAAQKLEQVVLTAEGEPGSNAETVCDSYIRAATQMLQDDVHDNQNIGKYGAEWIEKTGYPKSEQTRVAVVTHCNTGSLATAGYGTALGIVRSLHSRGSLNRVFYTETRPYDQGARLTGFELLHDNIPAEMVTDSMAGFLLSSRGKSENIAAIIVGADRVAANGDTANKIGSYSLAILAKHHRVKFIVAAPCTTIDMNTSSGSDIVIEQRPTKEMITVRGPETQTDRSFEPTHVQVKEVLVAPANTKVWNPAFDITPATLIDGIVTEKGVVEKGQDGRFRFDHLFHDQKLRPKTNGDTPGATPKIEEAISWDDVLRMKADEVGDWAGWVKPKG